MKKTVHLILILISCMTLLRAQTNTFPADGNAGIGTLLPAQSLSIYGPHSNTTIGLHYVNGDVTRNADLLIWASEPNWSFDGVGIGNNVRNNSGILQLNTARGSSYIRLLNEEIKLNVIKLNGTDINAMTIQNEGKVGIGTANPTERLDVNGNMKWGSGQDYTITGQDGTGLFIEQIGTSPTKSKIRIQTSKTGDGNNYAYLSIDPNGGFSFNSLGNGNSNVGIGTAPSSDKLAVNGKIRAKEIKVEIANWPDYVFAPDYKAMTLLETDHYIQKNKRLPEVPSAGEVDINGIELGAMNKLLLKKIEELTLHLIEKEKQMQASALKMGDMDKEIKGVKQLLVDMQSKFSNQKK